MLGWLPLDRGKYDFTHTNTGSTVQIEKPPSLLDREATSLIEMWRGGSAQAPQLRLDPPSTLLRRGHYVPSTPDRTAPAAPHGWHPHKPEHVSLTRNRTAIQPHRASLYTVEVGRHSATWWASPRPNPTESCGPTRNPRNPPRATSLLRVSLARARATSLLRVLTSFLRGPPCSPRLVCLSFPLPCVDRTAQPRGMALQSCS